MTLYPHGIGIHGSRVVDANRGPSEETTTMQNTYIDRSTNLYPWFPAYPYETASHDDRGFEYCRECHGQFSSECDTCCRTGWQACTRAGWESSRGITLVELMGVLAITGLGLLAIIVAVVGCCGVLS